jgi:dephospho-CoA kinase
MQIKIGITGGIGAGKSTVANYFQQENYVVLFADDIAKDFLYNDLEIRRKIIDTFGNESFQNGKPNKTFLSANVFNNKEHLNSINSIIHPPTLDFIFNQLETLHKKEKIVFIESALIFEADLEELFDYIIFVTAEEKIRIDRLIKNGTFTYEDIQRRINSQLPDDVKKEKSDFVIHNDDDLKSLKDKCRFILTLINSLIKSKN